MGSAGRYFEPSVQTDAAYARGKDCAFSDKIAYINHDIDDAIRALVLTEDDIPLELRKTLGFSTKQRLNTLIHNIIMNSREKDDIMMSPEIEGGDDRSAQVHV